MKGYSIVKRRSFEEQQNSILCVIQSMAMNFLRNQMFLKNLIILERRALK